jgi:ABC-2 type transport system ATP-binding protein
VKAVEVLGLSKRYGEHAALEAVSFDVEEGDAVAVLGPNGSGKTTLLRILATLLKPTAGYARVLGMDGRFQASKIRRVLGYMPDVVGMEEDLTVGEYLHFFAGLHGLGGAEREGCVKGLVSLLDLEEVRGRACGALSRGMQQRVGLARTLVHNPSVLLLDEPAANLDARARIEIREVLKELRKMGKTILISSHILMELEDLCNKIVVLQRGRVVFAGAVAHVAGRLRPLKRVSVRVSGDGARLKAALASEPDVEDVAERDGWLTIRLKGGREDYGFVARRAVAEGLDVLSLREEEAGLEEIFMRLTGDGPPAPAGGAP